MIHKVLCSTINYDHPQTGMLHAFRGIFGADSVLDLDYLQLERQGLDRAEINRRFLAAAEAFRPDWLWLQVQETEILAASTLQRVRELLPKAVITHWTGDMRPSVSEYLGGISRTADLTLCSSEGQIQAFTEAGAARVRYLQIGLDWAEDVQAEPGWEPPFRVPQVVLCGNHYGSRFPEGTLARESAIRALVRARIDVGVVGGGWPREFPTVGQCGVKQQAHVWRRALVALNVNHFNGVARYYSDRQLIAMASGTPVVCHYVPGLEHEFAHGQHCLWYQSEAELVEHVRALLLDERLRRRIGAAGRAEVIRRHTWFARILDILPEIEELQQSR